MIHIIYISIIILIYLAGGAVGAVAQKKKDDKIIKEKDDQQDNLLTHVRAITRDMDHQTQRFTSIVNERDKHIAQITQRNAYLETVVREMVLLPNEP